MSWIATAEALRMVALALFCPTLGECERQGRCLLFPLARACWRRCPILNRPRNAGCSILHILRSKDVFFLHSHVARRQRSKSPPIGRLPARFLMCSQWATSRRRRFQAGHPLRRRETASVIGDAAVAPGPFPSEKECRFGRLTRSTAVPLSFGYVAQPNRTYDGSRPIEPVGVDP